MKEIIRRNESMSIYRKKIASTKPQSITTALSQTVVKKRFYFLISTFLFLFTVLYLLFSVRATFAQASCPLPTAPSNVLVEYPGCQGDNCSLVQASCSWGAVPGATGYNVTITEVDTTTVIKQETVPNNNTYIFPVTQNRTYRCEVAATNTCGTGPAGQHELLCQVEGLVTQPAQASCGQPCTSQSQCIAGTTCLQTSTGGSVCAVAGSESACQANPGVAACCSAAPVGGGAPPPQAGTTENLMVVAGIGSLIIFGGSMLLIRSRS